jgi:protoheme ferro-lyase
MTETKAAPTPYDAFLLVSFGGPERAEDVLPFLENVTRGRGVPRTRLLEVAEHYHHFGGASPINAQNRQLLEAIRAELAAPGPALPVYRGKRNWHPLLEETVRHMAADGIRRALAFVTSGFASYSGCRQYREDIERAIAAVGSGAPRIDKLRLFYNHPHFIEAVADRTRTALAGLGPDQRSAAPLAFTAHSIPRSMAEASDYEMQLLDAAALVVDALGGHHPWRVVYQSRSGPPTVPWLEPRHRGPSRVAESRRRHRRRRRPDRLRVRPHGGQVRPRHGGGRPGAGPGPAARADRDAGHPPGLRAHGPGAGPRADRRRAAPGPRRPGSGARRLSARVLPGRVRRDSDPDVMSAGRARSGGSPRESSARLEASWAPRRPFPDGALCEDGERGRRIPEEPAIPPRRPVQ